MLTSQPTSFHLVPHLLIQIHLSKRKLTERLHIASFPFSRKMTPKSHRLSHSNIIFRAYYTMSTIMAVKLNSYSLAYDIFDGTIITRAHHIISTCQPC